MRVKSPHFAGVLHPILTKRRRRKSLDHGSPWITLDHKSLDHEAPRRVGRHSGKAGIYNIVQTGPSNPILPYGTFRASADPRKFGRNVYKCSISSISSITFLGLILISHQCTNSYSCASRITRKVVGLMGLMGQATKKERKSTDGAHFTDKCAYLCYKCVRCTAMPF